VILSIVVCEVYFRKDLFVNIINEIILGIGVCNEREENNNGRN
jgi:hypothetical protein